MSCHSPTHGSAIAYTAYRVWSDYWLNLSPSQNTPPLHHEGSNDDGGVFLIVPLSREELAPFLDQHRDDPDWDFSLHSTEFPPSWIGFWSVLCATPKGAL